MKSILGIGNALTDILAVLPDDTLLKTFHLPLGSMQHVDRETGDMIWNQLKTLDIHYVAGGSAANTIACTAVFGMPSGFIGKIGDDELGLLFKSDQEQYGVNTLLLKSHNPSGRSMVFVSGGNAERTFAVYLGAALGDTSFRTRHSSAAQWRWPAKRDASSPSTWRHTMSWSPTKRSSTTSWTSMST